MNSNAGGGFFQQSNGAGSQNFYGGGGGTQGNRNSAGYDNAGNAAQNRAKYHFHPVTMLMVKNGSSTPDDQFEVDGMLLQNVSWLEWDRVQTGMVRRAFYFWKKYLEGWIAQSF